MSRRKLAEFASRTTAHGVDRLVDASPARRFFWVVVCCFTYGTLLHLVYISARDWMDPDQTVVDANVSVMWSIYDRQSRFRIISDDYPRMVLCAPSTNFRADAINSD